MDDDDENLGMLVTAAATGDLPTVINLYTQVNRPNRSFAWTSASRTGQLDVIKWIFTHGDLTDNESCIGYAAGEGHVEIVEWLLSNSKRLATDIGMAIVSASGSGRIEMVAGLLARGVAPDPFWIERAIEAAVIKGHLGMVQWWVEESGHTTRKVVDELVSSAANNNHLAIVQWLVRRGGSGLERALWFADNRGNDAVSRWIRAFVRARPLLERFRSAVHAWLVVNFWVKAVYAPGGTGHKRCLETFERHRRLQCNLTKSKMITLQS